MSLSRQFFRELRPLFRMLDDVSFGRHQSPFGPSLGFPAGSRFGPPQDLFMNNFASQPAIDVADHGNHFTVEADLPGVPKENVEVRIGDKGHSITIEGKVTEKGGAEPSKTSAASDKVKEAETTKATTDTQAVTKADEAATQLSTERQFTRNVQFTRTVWLPRPVDAKKVEAKMKDGVLSLTLHKLSHDKESTTIPITDA